MNSISEIYWWRSTTLLYSILSPWNIFLRWNGFKLACIIIICFWVEKNIIISLLFDKIIISLWYTCFDKLSHPYLATPSQKEKKELKLFYIMLESLTLKCQNHLIIISYYHVLEKIKDIIPPATYIMFENSWWLKFKTYLDDYLDIFVSFWIEVLTKVPTHRVTDKSTRYLFVGI